VKVDWFIVAVTVFICALFVYSVLIACSLLTRLLGGV